MIPTGTYALVLYARRLGVTFAREGDAICCSAPRGVMMAELQAALKAHRDDIHALLSEPPDPRLTAVHASLTPEERGRLEEEALTDPLAQRVLVESTIGQPRSHGVRGQVTDLMAYTTDQGVPRA